VTFQKTYLGFKYHPFHPPSRKNGKKEKEMEHHFQKHLSLSRSKMEEKCKDRRMKQHRWDAY
jgi:hypothetical protein